MALRIRYSAGFIVVPSRLGGTPEEVTGSELTLAGPLKSRLDRLFEKELKTRIPVRFKADKQQNEVRTLVIAVARRQKTLTASNELARALGRAMDARTSPQSLFLVLAEAPDARSRVAVHFLKFPHDDGLGADVRDGRLVVRVLDQAFTAQSSNFKAASFLDDPRAATGFWNGVVEDRQARLAGSAVATYWIEGFLQAELRINGVQASTAVADALKALLSSATPAEGGHIASSAAVLAGIGRKRVTFTEIADGYVQAGLRERFLDQVKSTYGFDREDTFEFDSAVVDELFGFRVLMLDNQVSVSAPSRSFADLVRVTRRPGDMVDVRTSGRYSGTKLRRRAG